MFPIAVARAYAAVCSVIIDYELATPAAWHIGGDAPGFVLGEQFGCRRVAPLVLEIDIGQRVAVVILDDEAGIVRLIDGPR
jgi:hypothetical protein